MNHNQFELSTEQAERLVNIIKRGSLRSGVLVLKSLAATLTYRDKVKEEMKLDKYLGL